MLGVDVDRIGLVIDVMKREIELLICVYNCLLLP